MKSATEQVYDAIMAERQQARMQLVYDSFTEGEISPGDIQAGFPGEDFMSGLIMGLQGLRKTLRGENKALLSKLIEEAEALQDSTAKNAEYGMSELRSLENSLERIAAYA